MSSIADALKRAQQERERLRGSPPSGDPSADASESLDASLASVVLRKKRSAADSSSVPAAPQPPQVGRPAPVTPLSDAMRQAPPVQAPAERARQQAAQTIVEDYASKRKLNLPAEMVVYHDRAGAIAEQYRGIRDNLMQANPKREPQVLVVTSAVAGEGKTTTLINLGLSLVEIRANRVLLIDGCVRPGRRTGRQSLTGLLRLEKESGLVDLLVPPPPPSPPHRPPIAPPSPPLVPSPAAVGPSPGASLASSPARSGGEETFIKATPWHNLFVLPAGSPRALTSAAATELLKSGALRNRLREFRSAFDWILIDAPAALALPDAGLLAGPSDGILLAAALHRTPRDKIQTALRRFKSNNLPVRFCILTRA